MSSSKESAELANCTVQELKEICVEMNLPVTGRKAQLIERIIEADSTKNQETEQNECAIIDNGASDETEIDENKNDIDDELLEDTDTDAKDDGVDDDVLDTEDVAELAETGEKPKPVGECRLSETSDGITADTGEDFNNEETKCELNDDGIPVGDDLLEVVDDELSAMTEDQFIEKQPSGLSRCRLCNFFSSNSEAFQGHIDSETHKQRFMDTKSGKIDLKKLETFCEVCNYSVPIERFDAHCQRNEKHRLIESIMEAGGPKVDLQKPRIQPEIDAINKKDDPVLGLRGIRELFDAMDLKNPKFKYLCNICSLYDVSMEEMMDHVRSLRHRMGFLKRFDPRGITTMEAIVKLYNSSVARGCKPMTFPEEIETYIKRNADRFYLKAEVAVALKWSDPTRKDTRQESNNSKRTSRGHRDRDSKDDSHSKNKESKHSDNKSDKPTPKKEKAAPTKEKPSPKEKSLPKGKPVSKENVEKSNEAKIGIKDEEKPVVDMVKIEEVKKEDAAKESTDIVVIEADVEEDNEEENLVKDEDEDVKLKVEHETPEKPSAEKSPAGGKDEKSYGSGKESKERSPASSKESREKSGADRNRGRRDSRRDSSGTNRSSSSRGGRSATGNNNNTNRSRWSSERSQRPRNDRSRSRGGNQRNTTHTSAARNNRPAQSLLDLPSMTPMVRSPLIPMVPQMTASGLALMAAAQAQAAQAQAVQQQTQALLQMPMVSRSVEMGSVAQIQDKLECQGRPMLGLQYIVEFQYMNSNASPTYLCKTCNEDVTANFLIDHIRSINHRINYLVAHHGRHHRLLGPYFSHDDFRGKSNESEIIRHLMQLSLEVDKLDGIGKLRVERIPPTSKLWKRSDDVVIGGKRSYSSYTDVGPSPKRSVQPLLKTPPQNRSWNERSDSTRGGTDNHQQQHGRTRDRYDDIDNRFHSSSSSSRRSPSPARYDRRQDDRYDDRQRSHAYSSDQSNLRQAFDKFTQDVGTSEAEMILKISNVVAQSMKNPGADSARIQDQVQNLMRSPRGTSGVPPSLLGPSPREGGLLDTPTRYDSTYSSNRSMAPLLPEPHSSYKRY
ncbi:uncharacterized protein LOC141903808 [Tubulanus polymorphus]|uniref:uncharacterized protein LOC141903808 n=1 Tax=Tubulanus polymorphus TaxID=672921 RepID=UPI003DA4F630